MRRALLAILGLAIIAAGTVWLIRQDGAGTAADEGPARQSTAYDYEARDVIVRQMGADGRLQYQLEAREITQLPDSGQISAVGLTMRHDPPGTAEGGAYRWTLTADRAELPPDGNAIQLSGQVRARGRLQGGTTDIRVATEQLQYDMDAQEVSSSGQVTLNWGCISLKGRNLRVNIKTSDVALESEVHGTCAK